MKKSLLTITLSLSVSFFPLLNAQLISTVAGNGVQGYYGDGGQATAAEFYYPNAVGFDGTGNMYIADESNNVIREVNLSGIITTIAGNQAYGGGFGGDGGTATAAEIYAPEGVCADRNGAVSKGQPLFFNILLKTIGGVLIYS